MDYDMSEVKSAIEATGRAFEEFKKTNDERLKSIETKNHVDPLVESKLSKIEDELNSLEKINQDITLSAKNQENIQEKLSEIESYIKRPEVGMNSKQIDKNLEIYTKYLRKGKEGLEDAELKALTVGTDATAGYLAPEQYVEELLKTVTETSPIRQIARVRQTSRNSIRLPSRTGTFSGAWTAETGTRTETTGYTVAVDDIATNELYALVDISEALLEDSVFNLEAEMGIEFAEQFAKAEGTAFVSGNGTNKPEGFTVNADVTSVSGGSGAVTADTLLDLVHAISSQYAPNALFVFNRATLGDIRKLKDTAGQYVFQPGMSGITGVPNTILGYSYVEAPDMPDVASSAKCITFGDFRSAYTIVDRVSMSIMRDPFTQATSGNVRYIARRRVGGQVVIAEAIRNYVPTA